MGATEAIARYTYRMDGTRIALAFTNQLGSMTSKAQVAFNELQAIEERVKAILNGETGGLFTILDYFKYHAFARMIYKAQKRYGGGLQLINWVAMLHADFILKGCQAATLTKIRDEVFSIPAPAP